MYQHRLFSLKQLHRMLCSSSANAQPILMQSSNTLVLEQLPKFLIWRRDEEKLLIRFTFDFGKKTRTFNFIRHAEESLASLTERIDIKFNTRSKKGGKQKGSPENTENENISNSTFVRACILATTEQGTILDPSQFEVVTQKRTCRSVFLAPDIENHFLFRVCDQYFRFDLNPPDVTSIQLPDNIMVGFLVHPNKLVIQHGCIEHSYVKWFVSKKTFENYSKAKQSLLHNTWEEVGTGFTLGVTESMLNRLVKVRVVPRNGDREGESSEAISQCVVTSAPAEIPFQTRHLLTNTRLPPHSVRVVSYNILADTYASTEYSAEFLFPCCPRPNLMLPYRRQLLIEEIIGYNPDVLCLQEVDEAVFFNDFARVLLFKAGLAGLYAGKNSNSTKEGCAAFYNPDKFRLHCNKEFALGKELSCNPLFADLNNKIREHPELHEVTVSRPTVLQVIVLERLSSSPFTRPSLCECTRRHCCDEAASRHGEQVALNSDSVLLDEVVVGKKLLLGNDVSVLFCGDLNSSPDTGVVQLAIQGYVDDAHPGWGDDPDVFRTAFKQNLPLASACGTPEYTNYVHNFQATLDWIFYQTNKFTVSRVVPLLPHSAVVAHKALPSIVIPSDHLALVVDLKYSDQSS